MLGPAVQGDAVLARGGVAGLAHAAVRLPALCLVPGHVARDRTCPRPLPHLVTKWVSCTTWHCSWYWCPASVCCSTEGGQPAAASPASASCSLPASAEIRGNFLQQKCHGHYGLHPVLNIYLSIKISNYLHYIYCLHYLYTHLTSCSHNTGPRSLLAAWRGPPPPPVLGPTLRW